MAAGRDFQSSAPRWLNCLICCVGLLATGAFIWRVLLCQNQACGISLYMDLDFPRIMAAAMLPTLLFISAISAAAQRIVREM